MTNKQKIINQITKDIEKIVRAFAKEQQSANRDIQLGICMASDNVIEFLRLYKE